MGNTVKFAGMPSNLLAELPQKVKVQESYGCNCA